MHDLLLAMISYQLCDPKKQSTGVGSHEREGLAAPPGTEDADHQLCGATYAEL